MTQRNRVMTALAQQEPDKIPFDFSSTNVSGIAIQAYRRLVQEMNFQDEEIITWDMIQQLAKPSEQFLRKFKTEFRGLLPYYYANIPLPEGSDLWNKVHEQRKGFFFYRDEWQIEFRFKPGQDLYYTRILGPLDGETISTDQIETFIRPQGDEPWRYSGMAEKAEEYKNNDYTVLIRSVCSGLCEMGAKLRGMDSFFLDLALNESAAEKLIEQIFLVKLKYWQKLLSDFGESVDIIVEADDYGSQEALLLSPNMFNRFFKPYWKTLFSEIKKIAPHAKIFFHSCGAIRPLIPDFIDMGADILNPIHTRAKGMEPLGLKRDFGREICFWGGGIDTQQVLPKGTKEEVADEVKRSIDVLAPGGGWVFSPIHNVQADVPPENFLTMYRTFMENR